MSCPEVGIQRSEGALRQLRRAPALATRRSIAPIGQSPAPPSDLLTGLMRCPACGKAMIGTRAHGRSRVYRCYTCFTRVRYDTARCSAARLDADAVEHAVTTALAGFYRDQHDLIADAITQAQASHAAGQHGWRAELAAAEHDLAMTSAAIDRYLAAFENGTLDPEDLAPRLAQLNARSAQLRARRDELAA
jgi:site-specific DNA recombinase